MSVIPVLSSLSNVAKGKDVQLFLSTTSSCVDRKQNWPSDNAADKAYERQYLEEPEVQITIK